MNLLQNKIGIAQTIIQKAQKKTKGKNIVVAWSGGKESTVLLHIIRSMYKGTIPFNVSFGDSRLETKETYLFIMLLSKKWRMKFKRHYLLTLKEARNAIHEREEKELLKLLNKGYTRLMRVFIHDKKQKVLMWGNRIEDRNNKEKNYFKKQKNTWFVYPLLHFSEIDIWSYIYSYHVPLNKLYEKGYRNSNILPLLIKPTHLQHFSFYLIKSYIKIKIFFGLI